MVKKLRNIPQKFTGITDEVYHQGRNISEASEKSDTASMDKYCS